MGGFAGKGRANAKPDLGIHPGVTKLDAVATSSERLDFLMGELDAYRVSPVCFGTLRRLAGLSPATRLAVNIKNLVAAMACVPVCDNLLQHGLGDDERATLLEIDGSAIAAEARQTAHSLLNMTERYRVFSVLGAAMRDAHTQRHHQLERGLFDAHGGKPPKS